MADEKLTAITDATAIADTDLVAMVKDMGTTPATVARAWSLIKSTLKTYFDTLYTKATGAELDTGTDDVKFATAKAIKDAHNVPSVAPGTTGNVLTSDGTDWISAAASGGGGGGANALINGSFAVAQRGTSFTSATTPANSDDTYLLDRWILLSDGNDIVDVSQETSATIADPAYNIKLDVETANKKFGILQILEQKDARRLINQAVSLSFKAKITGTTIGAIRAAIIAWDSTADAPTSDVVSAWGAAGANPTLVANWTYENTPAALAAPTTSWQTYEIENITIDTASAANVAVFIWTDDVTMDVGDFLHIADVQLEIGAVATPFEFRSIAEEVALCRRYGRYFAAGGAYVRYMLMRADTTGGAKAPMVLEPPMRILPTLVYSALTDFDLNAGTPVTAFSISGSATLLTVAVTGTGTPYTVKELVELMNDDVSTSWFYLSAEL